MKPTAPSSNSTSHNAHQRTYYQARRPTTMLPIVTPYAKRHFDEAAQRAGLSAPDRVLELGAGMGRFSLQFAQKGCPLTVLELSPDLAGVCREALTSFPNTNVRVGDALAPSDDLTGQFDLVAGFFFLHHLPTLDTCFSGAHRCLRSGGRFVFVEPNPLNLLYYLQITFTPTMSWKSERGILKMREQVIREIATQAGFTNISATYYGALPRNLYDNMSKHGQERTLEKFIPLGIRPFVVFTGQRP